MSRIADERENRRGLVLGLTLAELLLLLLFLLLLALGWRMSILQKAADFQRERADSFAVKIEALEATMTALDPLVAEIRLKGKLDESSVQNLIKRIGRVELLEREVADLRRAKSELQAQYAALRATARDSDKLKKFDDAINAAAEINPNDPPEVLARALGVLRKLGSDTTPEDISTLAEMTTRLSNLSKEVRNLESERDKFKRQVFNLSRSGNGLTYPSCWTTQEGKTEYMFDVTIRDDGLIVRDATPSRANDPQMKMVSTFERGVVINERTFDRATISVFEWSQSEQCRFYSIIRDSTGPTSKQRYKEMRSLVEGHFYPLLLSPSSPAPGNRRYAPDREAAVGGPLIRPPGYREP